MAYADTSIRARYQQDLEQQQWILMTVSNMKIQLLTGAIAIAMLVTAARAQEPSTRWFREARFGMFIHWGLYSRLAGEWEGKRYYGVSEWIMNRARIPVKEYERTAASFNPVHFDAEQWVRTAMDAGMKYIVITAKHHDGFAMFRSAASSFNIFDATPFKRDPLKELAAACRKHGIRLGFYYSQTQDWHEPDAVGNTWDFDPGKADFNGYLKRKCEPQLKESLTNYGDLGILWFDTPAGITPERSRQLVDWVHAYQPGCLTTSRIGNGLGDYQCLRDHQLPDGKYDKPVEALFTHNDSWGYAENDKNFRSPKEIITLLVKCSAKGTNLLFNVGPRGDGAFPPESVHDLALVGKWLRKNGPSIYGTTASPFPEVAWGAITAAPGKLFLHVIDYPPTRRLLLPGFNGHAGSVRLLADSRPLKWSVKGKDLEIILPSLPPGSLIPVVEVTYTGRLDPAQSVTLMEDLPLDLQAGDAVLTGRTILSKASWMEKFGKWKYAAYLDAWKDTLDAATWHFRSVRDDECFVELEYNLPSAQSLMEGILRIDGRQLYFHALPTGKNTGDMVMRRIGRIPVKKGMNRLSIRPLAPSDTFLHLKSVRLTPAR
jgi:alpha-L-fucosidase